MRWRRLGGSAGSDGMLSMDADLLELWDACAQEWHAVETETATGASDAAVMERNRLALLAEHGGGR